MSNYLILLVMFLVVFYLLRSRKRKKAAIVNHRLRHKGKESSKMRGLAEKFIGKDCIVYSIVSEGSLVKGVIKEVTDNGLLIESDGNIQAVNLEYVTRIREWPKNAKGKKKTVFD